MRITNKMMTNTSLSNINKNKNRMSTLDQQYSTGKKIQRPSDDPIIAVRALKLRTTVTELNQYYKKNIPDALSWMEVTESALSGIDTILENIHTQLTQGSNDSLNKDNRAIIAKNLAEMKLQIYQEGNTNYAGRYVFTGYKTNTSLIFNEESLTTKYAITEKFAGKEIELYSKVTGGYDISDYSATSTSADFADAPNLQEGYRIRLSYSNLDDVPASLTDNSTTPPIVIPIEKRSLTGADGEPYTPDVGEVNFIPETGELILSKEVYESLRLKEAGDINVVYEKTSFKDGELRPEHYFDCTTMDTLAADPATTAITYDVDEEQEIKYEITHKQKLKINILGKDAISHGIARDIEELEIAIEEVTLLENNIAEVKELIESPNTSGEQIKVLNKLKEQMDTDLVLKNKILHDKYESGLTSTENYQKQVNVMIADSGSRYKRLQLTDSRLDTQLVDTKELMSSNEDANLAEVIINYMSAETIYNASLTAASKIVKNTLLDFI